MWLPPKDNIRQPQDIQYNMYRVLGKEIVKELSTNYLSQGE